MLENKTAVIYGAGGAIGGAVARAFAREGARLFLTGHNVAKVDAVAKEIDAGGGVAETAQVDALDEKAVEEHLNTVVEAAFNASDRAGAMTGTVANLRAGSITD